MKLEFLKRGKNPPCLLILVIVSLLFLVPRNAKAQSPIDNQMDQVVAVINSTLTPCGATNTRECVKVTKPGGGLVNASDERTVNQSTERTSISVIAASTEEGAQSGFQSKAQFYGDPANNVFHGTLWRSEKFAAGSGPTEDSVLQVSLSPNDTRQGDAIGYMFCGNLDLELSMTLFHPSDTGVVGQQAVENTQMQLKSLMQKLNQALKAAGACTLGGPPPKSYPAAPPDLATISEIDNMVINIKRAPNSDPNTDWQKRVGTGVKLHYGDTFCFRGQGTVKLTWYDGSTISFSDPNALGERGKNMECFEINLKRPEDMTSPGVIRDSATWIFKLVTEATPALTRIAIDALKPPPEIQEKDVIVAIKGTTFVIGQDPSTGATLVCAEEHAVHVTPLNTALAPFELTAGNQVRVTADTVSDITPGCTLPSPIAIPQPNLGAAGMTLQAPQRFVTEGDTVLLPIWLVNAQNLANLNFELRYDPSVLQLAGDTNKGNLLDNTLFKSNPNQAGNVLVGLAQTSPLSGTGTVMNIPFRVIGKPGDFTPLLLNVTTINDPNGGNLAFDRIQGEITVVNDDGTLPPDDGSGTSGGGSGTSGGGGGANAPIGIQNGDCDGDGQLTELDALCALEMSTALRTPRLFLDMDGDKNVTSRDAVLLLQRVVGQ